MVRLWDLWVDKTRERRVMKRGEFDAFAFRPLLGRLNLVSVEPGEPLQFRYRLFGSAMDDPCNGDMTARTVADVKPAAYADLVRRALLEAYRSCRPVLREVKIDLGDDEQMHYCRLVLPMSSGADICDLLLVASVRFADDHHQGGGAGASDLGQQGVFRYHSPTVDA